MQLKSIVPTWGKSNAASETSPFLTSFELRTPLIGSLQCFWPKPGSEVIARVIDWLDSQRPDIKQRVLAPRPTPFA